MGFCTTFKSRHFGNRKLAFLESSLVKERGGLGCSESQMDTEEGGVVDTQTQLTGYGGGGKGFRGLQSE